MRQIARSKRTAVLRGVREPRHPKQYAGLGASLGLQNKRVETLIEEVQAGLSYKALETLSAESGIPLPEIASIIELPGRTLARRKFAGRLAPAESERLLRISNAFEKTVGLFEGSVEGAVRWLRTPKRALANKTPLDYLRTEIGARQVEDLIGKLEHGVFA